LRMGLWLTLQELRVSTISIIIQRIYR